MPHIHVEQLICFPIFYTRWYCGYLAYSSHPTLAIPLHRTPDPPLVPNPPFHGTVQGGAGRENGLYGLGTGGSSSKVSVTSSVQRVTGVLGDGGVGRGSGGYIGIGFGDMGRSEGAAASPGRSAGSSASAHPSLQHGGGGGDSGGGGGNPCASVSLCTYCFSWTACFPASMGCRLGPPPAFTGGIGRLGPWNSRDVAKQVPPSGVNAAKAEVTA